MQKQDKTIGEWHIQRLDKQTLKITLPEGMYVDGEEPLTLDDIRDLIQVYIDHGPVAPKCCNGRTAIA